MQLDLYKKSFDAFFDSEALRDATGRAVVILRNARRVIFIGNGGSNAISGHMMEDYMKIAGKPTLSFTDPALITCFANDFGYEHAMSEWIRRMFQEGDVLVAISSSGMSANIVNAAKTHIELGGMLITLTGFKGENTLHSLGHINMHLPVHNYGIVECFHQVLLHAILDELAQYA